MAGTWGPDGLKLYLDGETGRRKIILVKGPQGFR